MRFVEEFRDESAAKALLAGIRRASEGLRLSIMEVCGGHTHSIHRHGLPGLLPDNIRLVSGPGCPVCVTPVNYVDRAIAFAKRNEVIVATFGDMMRVPGTSSSLAAERAAGADIRVCYSPLEALDAAKKNPGRKVVFLGVGFETTAPITAMALRMAAETKLKNFFLLSSHKTMPRALRAVASSGEVAISGIICPGHVSAVTGSSMYRFLAEEFRLPCVISGFEPLDILQSILMIAKQAREGRARVEIQYTRVVGNEGNPKAIAVIEEVFEPCDDIWRGFGLIPGSGLSLREKYAEHDAAAAIPVSVPESRENPACACGDIMRGFRSPADCPLFGKVCTPKSPCGPCMVSGEGSCAALFRYGKGGNGR